MTDYQEEYLRCDSVCGAPFPEFVEFFASAAKRLSVLDLGCGQGRDALVAARHGHSVFGIDMARSGISQLRRVAEAEGLDLTADVLDLEQFRAERAYDVVVLDRVLHMLPSEERRRTMLLRCRDWVAQEGHILVADTKRNRALVRACFDAETWSATLDRRDFFFARRIHQAHRSPTPQDIDPC